MPTKKPFKSAHVYHAHVRVRARARARSTYTYTYTVLVHRTIASGVPACAVHNPVACRACAPRVETR